jgi:uncharacterized protein YqeY
MTEKGGGTQDQSGKLVVNLTTDLKASMKNKNTAVRDAIRMIISEYPKLTVPVVLESGKKTTRPKNRDEITDDDILHIIRGLAKSEKIVLDAKGEKSSRYLEILESYLPKMADKEEIESWIRENIDLAAFKSPMQAMGPIMRHFGKLADGAMVKSILQKLASAGR